jgi:predicted MFS family arabinose efflux permease
MQISLLEGLADIKDVLMSSDVGPRAASAPPAISRLGPFRHASFTALWIATIVSNIGGWMYSAASGWLMTSLSPDPFTVSLVQVAVSLPMFLLAIPAGALADIVDLRKLLIGTEIAIAVVSAAFALIVWLDAATVANLLLFTFLNGVLGVLQAPAWQAVVPQLVPPQSLQGAIAANSVGINISRAVGPALGGMILARFGLAVPFFVNAVSYLGMVGVLFCWRPPQRGRRHLPVEQFGSAIRTGFRHARNNPHLQATMIRGAAFFLFATAYWALLPLIAREQIAGGPELYGVILGVIGVGAVGGAFALRWMESKLGADWLVAAGTIGTVIAMVLFAVARGPVLALSASIIAGAAWTMAVATLNVSAQVALPDWVRGRGLAMFVTIFFGAMAAGSAIWGQTASMVGLQGAQFIAAAGALVAIPLTWRWKLGTGASVDLTPSMHWPEPIMTHEVERHEGPVLVTVEYQIDPRDRARFPAAMDQLGYQRRRNGAYGWGVFEDSASEGRMVETFLVESWLEHLRQHERVTKADRVLQDLVNQFQTEGSEPKTTHLIGRERD